MNTRCPLPFLYISVTHGSSCSLLLVRNQSAIPTILYGNFTDLHYLTQYVIEYTFITQYVIEYTTTAQLSSL